MSTCTQPDHTSWCWMLRPPPLPHTNLITAAEYINLTQLLKASDAWQCYRDACNASSPSPPPPTLLPATAASSSAWWPLVIALLVVILFMGIISACYYRYRKRTGRISIALPMDQYQDTNYLHNKAVKKESWQSDTAATADDLGNRNMAIFQTQNNDMMVGKALIATQEVDNLNEHAESSRKCQTLLIEADQHTTSNGDASYDNTNVSFEKGDKFGHSPGGDSGTPLVDEVDASEPTVLPTQDHKLQSKHDPPPLPASSREKIPQTGTKGHSKPKMRSSAKKKQGQRKSKTISDPGAHATTDDNDLDTAGRKRSV